MYPLTEFCCQHRLQKGSTQADADDLPGGPE